MIGGIKVPTNGELLQIVKASQSQAASLGFGQSGEQKGCENGDNGNDDQQFNEGECGLGPGRAKACSPITDLLESRGHGLAYI